MRVSFQALTAAAISVAFMAVPGFADELKYHADLTAAQETPATDSTGTGTLDASYDTSAKTLSWTVTYSGLTGDVTAAHFHGPAAAGAKAPPVVPVSAPYASPIKGSATLTAQQTSDLQAGMWYFNLHTAKYPDGELRGQVTEGDGSSSMASSMEPMASFSSAAQ
ncbi:MAG: CHRD domain-containing protein [Devosia sp.]